MTNQQPTHKTQAELESVIGRGNGRGIPELSHAVFRMADGSKLEARMPRPTGVEVPFRGLPVLFSFIDFDVCPICLEPEPDSQEHVPPHSIGGNALTMSCERCNNEFGSKYEPHLRDWYEGSLGTVRLSSAAVMGARFAGEFLLRETADGGFMLLQQGKRDPESDRVLEAGGQFQMEYITADRARSHIAAVKSAYLAACLAVRAIPTGSRADALRAELVAARDTPRDNSIELSPLMKSIRVARTAGTVNPGEILLMAPTELETDDVGFVISFNRVFAVDWPLDPIENFFVVKLESGQDPSVRKAKANHPPRTLD
ncbi:HNH endonuclease [Leifsonia shinshuensis]